MPSARTLSAFICAHLRLHILLRAIAVTTVAAIVIGLVGQLIRDRFLVTHLMLHVPLLPLGAAALVSGVFWRGSRRMRGALLVPGIAGLGLGAWPMIGWGTSTSSPANAGRDMTLVHWNVRWGGGGGGVDGAKVRWDSACADVARHAPDIVVLSEAPSRQYVSALCDTLGDGWTFVQVRNPPRAWYMYSLAVCSRWPVTLERESEIPTGRAMLATVAAPGGDVRVLVADGESWPLVVRTPRLRAVSDACRAARDAGAPVHVVAGDFNAVGRSVGFDDLRAAGYASASESTRGWRATWPSPCPIYDIDHVWLSDDLAVTGCELFANTVSDHRGTAVRVRLRNESGALAADERR